MMAFDRNSGASALDPVIMTELRMALSRSVQSGNHGEELKTLLARAAGDARSRGLQAEQLILVLKDVWSSVPHLSMQSNNETQTRLLQQLIARCIQAYYGG